MLVKALGLAIKEKKEDIVKMISAAGADVKELFVTVILILCYLHLTNNKSVHHNSVICQRH